MLTIQEVNERLSEIAELSQTEDKKLKKKLVKSKKEWDLAKLYLENNPSFEYLKEQKTKISKLLFSINDQFPEWMKHQNSGKTLNDYRKEYQKLKDVPKLRLQLKTVNFLLHQ